MTAASPSLFAEPIEAPVPDGATLCAAACAVDGGRHSATRVYLVGWGGGKTRVGSCDAHAEALVAVWRRARFGVEVAA